jgi:hypothetical protein
MSSLREAARGVLHRLRTARSSAYDGLMRRVPPGVAGAIDWHVVERLRSARSGSLAARRYEPFNGQARRIEIVDELLQTIDFRAIVETGSYRGATTEHLRARSALPIFTVEREPRFFHYCRLRFRHDPQVHVRPGDSRAMLEELASSADFPHERVFFYLDAHWGEDLPLADELRLVAQTFRQSVIMIDDFEVPGDPDYSFDDDGPGKRLALDYLPSDALQDFRAFWPAAPGATDTGERRGCIVLASAALEHEVAAMRTLRADGHRFVA